MNIRLITALGNNDPKYFKTRHNVGFWWIDQLAHQNNLDWQKSDHGTGSITKLMHEGKTIILFKPGLLMNINGQPIAKCAHYFKIPSNQILLIYDDLDLNVGIIKLKQSEGHGGHNGVRDLQQLINIKEILRLKIGIGKPKSKDQTSNYVLQKPSKSDEDILKKNITQSQENFQLLLSGNINKYQQYIAKINQGDS